MDSLGESVSTSGLFLFRENYYPKKPNLSKIFSYGYILCALILIVLYCSPINGLRCSKQSYVAACETNVITSQQCDNLLIVDCQLDCEQKGLSPGMTCNYQICGPGDPNCWQSSGGGGGGGGSSSGKPKSCGPGNECEYGKTGYSISTVSSVTGPTTCQNYLNIKKSIDKDQGFAPLRNDFPGQYPAKLKSCCGILKESVGTIIITTTITTTTIITTIVVIIIIITTTIIIIVCLSPSAVIGVVGGYLSILLSIFQVLFMVVARLKKDDVFKKVHSINLILITIITTTNTNTLLYRMGHLILTDPFGGYRKV